ncbi:hypothetical protein J2Z69_003015 [Paenibacillus shirakamiensis]|uniref:HNH nuclease domain-containing protein n=1 Tax=Paenibacillus shirakamiensis TaxID=1265935 RepID=A0ABS4JMX3_9BACL|nr:HNH endonuclease [Paenibacillus shirakamiensis]MBP2001959.1 hypothetical protein [Paenibacillus shirakamiensis]
MNKKRTDEATEPIMKSVHQVSSRGTSQGIAEMSCVVQEKFVSPHAQRRIYQHPPRNRTDPSDPGQLRPTRQGTIRMLGFTDQGRRWQQEIDPTLATILVEQHAAVVVNRHTIRRLFSNKDFKQFILSRDDHTCWFCGNFGDTIDHLHPRAKGGHTTPVNCVCACNVCNQIKADRDLHEFLREIDEMRSRTREGITNI